MTLQSVGGDIGGGADQVAFGKFGASGVDLRHQGDHFLLEQARSNSAFDRSSGDASAERFRQNQQIDGTRVRVCSNAVNIHNSRDGQTLNGLGIANAMATDDIATDLGRLGRAAAQNGRNDVESNQTSTAPN